MRIILLFLICSILGFYLWEKHYLSAPTYKGPSSSHFDGKEFSNLDPYKPKGLWKVLKWRFNRQDPQWPTWVENRKYPLPPKQHDVPHTVLTTFINHSTVLIQVDGVNILTDPIWSERASPFSWVGPKRIRDPGLSIEELPPIDIVLLSHNHYDHTDLATIKKLEKKFTPLFITGLGNDLLLKQNGIAHVHACDWWDTVEYKELSIHFVPAQHFSGRGLSDRMKTLWGGFAIESSAGSVFFAGDTALGSHFNEIRERLGSTFLALFPIGAYEPRDFMVSSHLNPEESVEAFQVLNCQYAIGIHFNTFNGLADEAFEAPKTALQQALKTSHISPDRFVVLDFGESKQWTHLQSKKIK